MSRCNIVRAALVGMVIVSLARAGTARAEVVLGASFGYTHSTFPDVPDVSNDVVAMPAAEEWHQPGLRVGYLATGRRWDLNADIGLVHRSGTVGEDETVIELLPQIQLNGRDRSGFSPFLNGGAGVDHETTSISPGNSISATRGVLGAGMGVRKSVSAGHGLLRIELRYEYLPKWEKQLDPLTSFSLLATNLFTIKLGFDLVVAR